MNKSSHSKKTSDKIKQPQPNTFKLGEFKIDPENPFEGDKLKREKNIINLTQLIQNWQGSLVMAVNSPWGTGKTVFVKMWQAYLNEQNYTTIYYNAWENDYSEEPMGTLLVEIGNMIKDKKSGMEQAFTAVARKGLKIGSMVVPLLIKALTSGILDLTKIKSDDFDLASLTEKIADEELKAFQNKKETMEDFKTEFQEFAEKVTDVGKPLVFFIDELDRCRPDFAIQLLEKVKHFFGIEKVVFIIAVDRKQFRLSRYSSIYKIRNFYKFIFLIR